MPVIKAVYIAKLEERLLTHLKRGQVEYGNPLSYIELFAFGSRNIIDIGFAEARERDDPAVLHSAVLTYSLIEYYYDLHQHNKHVGVPESQSYDGTGGAGRFAELLGLAAAGRNDLLPGFYNNNQAYFTENNLLSSVASNVCIALLKDDTTWLENEAHAAIRRGIDLKQHGKFEKEFLGFLSGLVTKDAQTMSATLQELCDSYRRATLWQGRYACAKDFPYIIYGLYGFARYIVSPEIFTDIVMPSHDIFWKEYADISKPGAPFLIFEGELAPLNFIYEKLA